MQTINSAIRKVPGWVLYIIGAAYGAWLFYLGATGGLGVEPIEALEHRYGKIAFQLILVGLAVTPLRQYLGLNLMCWRRAIGVLAFFFVLAHFLVWAVLDVQRLSAIWADILERPYVTIGMAGFLCLIPLGLTSNNWSVRKMGAASWRKLHKLVYPAAVLGSVHWIWLAKGFQIEPLVYLAITLTLLATRIRLRRPRTA
ncbi:protein-methionine-sulfoxide reductase heme-binding subunit MsrQ [Hasllibacter sp. MH4015]|uniref:protein-methionine-sulfoxide reductase heme-binding subunit MsrQ n=1 Tax=Hasllibacter sp. MH4015 TaxID=2854029 RepID=UPI001CD6BD00|nr:protein-methionine-sulfoxide reductase heme-binding subunit MsrQ [Hasllibacter sp. MH4015]